jgi:hypothetical protein
VPVVVALETTGRESVEPRTRAGVVAGRWVTVDQGS